MANLYKKTIYVTDPATGKETKTLSKKWYARYVDVDGIQRRVALAAALKTPVDEHLDEFEQHLISKNNTPEHVTQTINQIKVYLEETKPRNIAQINLASVEKFLSSLRQSRNVSLSTCNHYIRAINPSAIGSSRMIASSVTRCSPLAFSMPTPTRGMPGAR